MRTDTTFFTNEPDATLLDRFKKTLQTTQHFDVLVGYFRTSGFHRLYDAFEGIDKIRILVGLNVDRQTYEILEETRASGEPKFHQSTGGCKTVHNAENHYHGIGDDQYQKPLGIFIKTLRTGLRRC